MTTTPRSTTTRRFVVALAIAGAALLGGATPASARDNAPTMEPASGLPCTIPGGIIVQDGTYYWVRQADGTLVKYQCKNGTPTKSAAYVLRP